MEIRDDSRTFNSTNCWSYRTGQRTSGRFQQPKLALVDRHNGSASDPGIFHGHLPSCDDFEEIGASYKSWICMNPKLLQRTRRPCNVHYRLLCIGAEIGSAKHRIYSENFE